MKDKKDEAKREKDQENIEFRNNCINIVITVTRLRRGSNTRFA